MRAGLAWALAWLALPALADEQPLIPADKYVYCTVCHGVALGGNVVIAAPRLSGMQDWYVARQLRAFKNGLRGTHDDDAGGQEMRPMAAALDEREIVEVSDYVSAVRSAEPEHTVDGVPARGRALYASCVACHGADAGGNEALGGPALAGLNDWYLLTQLRNYKAGVRGSHPDDSYGRQMRAAAALLADEQAMRDVVRYIATLAGR